MWLHFVLRSYWISKLVYCQSLHLLNGIKWWQECWSPACSNLSSSKCFSVFVGKSNSCRSIWMPIVVLSCTLICKLKTTNRNSPRKKREINRFNQIATEWQSTNKTSTLQFDWVLQNHTAFHSVRLGKTKQDVRSFRSGELISTMHNILKTLEYWIESHIQWHIVVPTQQSSNTNADAKPENERVFVFIYFICCAAHIACLP